MPGSTGQPPPPTNEISSALAAALYTLNDSDMDEDLDENETPTLEQREKTQSKRRIQDEPESSNKSNKMKVIENIPNLPSQVTDSLTVSNSPNLTQTEPNHNMVSDNNSSSINNQSLYEKSKYNFYDVNDQGPFALYVDVLNKSKVHTMSIGKLIRDCAFNVYKEVCSIVKLNAFRIKIVLSSSKAANFLIKQSFWEPKGLGCYIPNFLLFRQGIIRNVDPTLSENEIVECAESEYKIIGVRRIFKKINEGRRPLPVINVTFRGQSLPNIIKILGVICSVEPYIKRVVQCFRCLLYGHISKTCNYKGQRCEFCAGSHEKDKQCDGPIVCIHCEGNHKSTDSSCPEFLKQKLIKDKMGTCNISFSEARESLEKEVSKVNNEKNNTYAGIAAAPPINTEKNYPPLPHHNSLNRVNIQTIRNNNVKGQAKPPTSQIDNYQNVSNTLNIPRSPIISNPAYVNNLNADKIVEIISQIIGKILPQIGISQPFSNELSQYVKNIVQESIKNNLLPTVGT